MHQLPAFGTMCRELGPTKCSTVYFEVEHKEEILLTAGNCLSSFADYCKLCQVFNPSNGLSCMPSLLREAGFKKMISNVFSKNLTLLLRKCQGGPVWSLRQLLFIQKLMISVYSDTLGVVIAAWTKNKRQPAHAAHIQPKTCCCLPNALLQKGSGCISCHWHEISTFLANCIFV